MEHFAPTVIIDGVTVTPESWMWILAFALQDIPWAIEEAKKPEFKAQIADYFKRKEIYETNLLKQELEERLVQLNTKLEKLYGLR